MHLPSPKLGASRHSHPGCWLHHNMAPIDDTVHYTCIGMNTSMYVSKAYSKSHMTFRSACWRVAALKSPTTAQHA